MNRLLLIDQDSSLREELINQLQSGDLEIDSCGDVETARTMVTENSYDLILLDPVFQPDNEHQLLVEFKQNINLKWIPIFVLAKESGVDDKLKFFDMGADDYVQKPIHLKELKARIQSFLSRAGHFEEMAFKDPLTKIYNRRYFDHQIKVLLQLTQRNQVPISLAFIDADKFKSINDTYGHHVGDLVLIGLADAIQKQIRSSDLVARFGGEEFVIAFPNANAQQAAARVNEILNFVRENPIAEHDGQQRYVTFSSGVAEWKPGMLVKDWIHLADEGVYQAKETGRNRVIITKFKDDDEVDPSGKTCKLMILEDNNEIDSLIKSGRFSDLPIHVIEVDPEKEGEELIEFINSHNIDVFITCGSIRSIEKLEFLDRVKNSQEQKDLKTLLVTEVDENILLHSLKLGVDEILPIPLNDIDLEISLKRLMA